MLIEDVYLTRQQAAEFLGWKLTALDRLMVRARRDPTIRAPTVIKYSHKGVRFRKADLIEFQQSCMRRFPGKVEA